MKTLHSTVVDKIATYRQRDGVIVCGNSDYVIEFTFDSEWDAQSTKTARFVTGSKYIDVVFEGTSVAVPVIKGAESVTVGVFAGNLKTTTPAVIMCQKSILCDDGLPADPTPDVYAQIMALLNAGGGGGGGGGGQFPKISSVTLFANRWVGNASPYSQVVAVAGATAYSQVDLTPSIEQLSVFYQKDLAFVTENDGGVITVYALGDKPMNDYTIQVT